MLYSLAALLASGEPKPWSVIAGIVGERRREHASPMLEAGAVTCKSAARSGRDTAFLLIGYNGGCLSLRRWLKKWSQRVSRSLLSECLLAAVLGLFLAMAATKAPNIFAKTPPPSSGAAAPQMDTERAQLEKDKLKLEIDKLRDELNWLTQALRLTTVVIPVAVVVFSVVLSHILSKHLKQLESAEANRRVAEEREAGRFSALVEDRARTYALAYAKLSPTALFFPAPDVEPGASPSSPGEAESVEPKPAAPAPPEARSKGSPQLTKNDCAGMGRQLSSWYFGDGGLLMTEDSRDAYFALMEALRRAAAAPEELAVQTVGEHAQVISLSLMNGYRRALAKKCLVFEKLEAKNPVTPTDLAEWKFGPLANPTSDAERFKDYVLIQTLASRFRTTLTDDIGSRKPPANIRESTFREQPEIA